MRHTYLRNYATANHMPVGCLVVELDRVENKIRYAFSACAPKDKFDRFRAREIATGRLATRARVIDGIPKGGFEITRVVMEDIVTNNAEQGKRARPNVEGAAKETERTGGSLVALEAARSWLEHAREVANRTEVKNAK